MNGEPALRDLAITRLGTLVERRDVPAVSYAVVADGEVTVGGRGGTGADTVFQIGSVTKGLTGLLLADLAARGQVPCPARPRITCRVHSPGPVTLLDLATHTAGLPRLPPGLRRYALLRPHDPYAWYPARRFLREACRPLASAPGGGQPHLYSNYGFGLLGYLLGQAAGAEYERLVADRVCAPLGSAGHHLRRHARPGSPARAPGAAVAHGSHVRRGRAVLDRRGPVTTAHRVP